MKNSSHKIDRDYFNYDGTSKEYKIDVNYQNSTAPLIVYSFGITNEDPNYQISRNNSKIFILEYVEKGQISLINNGKNYLINKNDTYLLEPGSTHKYSSNPNNPIKKYWINFNAEYFFALLDSFNLVNITHFPQVNIKSEFEELLSLYKGKELFNDEIYEKISLILMKIILKLEKSIKNKDSANDIVDRICNFIRLNILSKFTYNDLIKEFGISKENMLKLFQSSLNMTPFDYIHLEKIRLIKQMLYGNNYTIKNISIMLSFSSEYHMSSFFKKYTGLSPSEFKKINGVKK